MSEERRQLDPLTTRVVESLERTVDRLVETVEILRAALFGRWDADTNQMVPGLRDDVTDLKKRVVAIETKMDAFTAQTKKYGIWLLGPMLTILVLRAFGVPTELIWTLVASVAKHLGGTQ